MSKIVQLGGFLFGPPNVFGSTIKEKISSLANSIKNSFVKELKNKDPKEIDSNLFVYTGRNIIGKKTKKGISSITDSRITLTNNEIKDIIKEIQSLENRETLLKRTTAKITSQEGGFLNFLRPLMTAGLSLMKSVLTPLAKSVLLPFGLSAAMSGTDAVIQTKIHGSGTTALIISNEKMEVIMKIVKSLEESGLLIKRISEAIKNEAKQQKGGFLPMLLGTLTVSILGNALTENGVIRVGKGVIRTGQNF